MKNKLLILIPAIILATLATVTLWAPEPEPLIFDDIRGISIISPPVPLPEFNLLNKENKMVNKDQLTGQWTLAFFGYTHCPDICPGTLNSLSNVAKELRKSNPEDPTQYLFVSLDPARDTPDVIKHYVDYFDPNFEALTGDKSEIDKITERVGVIYDYEYEDERAQGDYVVNHYTAILVFDPQARLRAHILPPHPTDKVSAAFTRIKDYYGD